jgi:hypothetical protein
VSLARSLRAEPALANEKEINMAAIRGKLMGRADVTAALASSEPGWDSATWSEVGVTFPPRFGFDGKGRSHFG